MSSNERVAVVTGGGSGIGEAICMRLAREGTRVAVLDVDEQAAELTADLVGGGLVVVADVSDPQAVEAGLAAVEEALGPVDVWINNAGITGRHDDLVNPRAEQQMAEAGQGTVTTPLESLVRLSDQEWRRMLAVHLDGTFYCTRAAARSMASRGEGAIVNIASICGVEGCTGFPHYSAAKAGILGFTRAVAKELIVQGVRVNAIAPGFVDTPMMSHVSDALIEATRVATPAGRLGRPDEIAATVAFLVSDDASFFVGETVSPNGGMVTT